MTDQNTFAIAELQQKANNGDAQAQFDLAFCYADGTEIEINRELAFEWHKKAAEQGHVNAQFALGLYYFISKDRWQISHQIIQTFSMCESQTKYQFLGEWQPNAHELDFTLFRLDPAIGLAVKQARAAKSCDADDGLAFLWLTKAAEQNHPDASYWLGKCYRDGIGTQQNDELAFENFNKAAELGYKDAYYWLALCYRDGKGCRQNDELAFVWITKAVEYADAYFLFNIVGSDLGKNLAETYLFLGKLYAEGKGVAQNDDVAFHWYEKAAEKEVTEAHYLLAHCYEYGIGVEINISSASNCYETAAELGVSDADAEYRLAKYYLYGDGVEKDYSIGMDWLIKAVQANHAEAYQWLENTYLNFVFPYFSERKEVDQCHEFAFEWLLSGHEQNPEDFEINFGLAVLYAFGKGVEKNQELAVKHFLACIGECHKVYGREVADNFSEIFYDFSDMFNDISAGTVKSYYFDALAPFFLAKNPMAMDTKKSFAVLPSLRIAFHLDRGEFELLKEFLNSFEDLESSFNYSSSKKNFKNMGLTAKNQAEDLVQINQELEEKNKQLKLEIQRKESLQIRMQKLVEQFTHSLGNVIFPDTIYQVAERLKTNPECHKDVLLLNEAYHSEIIIKLQGELLRQRHTNTNPENFRQLIRACRQTYNNGDKSKSIADVLDYAASRVAARFLNQHNASLSSIRDKILFRKGVTLETLKQKFEDDILLNRSLGSVEWINQNLRPFKVVNTSPLWQKVIILAESHAEALLFGHFSEALFNAFKYADHAADEFLTVVFDENVIDGKTYLTCSWRNPIGDKAANSLGTGKGLDAILEDLMQLNDTQSESNSLLIAQDHQQFQVTMSFKKDLLIDEPLVLNIKRKLKPE